MEMGIFGAVGNIHLTPLSCGLLLQCPAASDHPFAVSPRPWAKMTVAVCLLTAGSTMGAWRGIAEAILITLSRSANSVVKLNEGESWIAVLNSVRVLG